MPQSNLKTAKKLCFAAAVGAVYTLLSLVFAPISFGPVQFRVSEALCVLPFLIPESIVGLFVGCVISNMLGGFGLIDTVFGSLATLIAGFLTWKSVNRYVALLPPVVVNALVIGPVLAFALTPEAVWPSMAVFGMQVGVGELGVMVLLGLPLLSYLPRIPVLRDIMAPGRLNGRAE